MQRLFITEHDSPVTAVSWHAESFDHLLVRFFGAKVRWPQESLFRLEGSSSARDAGKLARAVDIGGGDPTPEAVSAMAELLLPIARKRLGITEKNERGDKP